MMVQTSQYRTLIADDEQPARDRLKKLLADHADKIELIGEAQNGPECRELIDRLKPDLVFLDIQMPGLTGFEVLQQTTHSPVVVFCTAYDEFALQAFETNSIDYIVKPVKAERVQKSIEKLDVLKQNSNKQELLQMIGNYLQQAPKKDITSIPVKLGDRMLFVKIEDVAWFEADEKYVTIHLCDGKTYLCDLPLKTLEEKLDSGFIRIHRSLLVSVNRIKEINRHFNGCFIVRIDDIGQTKLQSGRGYGEQVKKLMEI
ncbi:MAG: response regulator transcription factor [Prolixibacteraceae bacterium]|nr:response regulator transcription factor [Prolixibacteraceae bacterium]